MGPFVMIFGFSSLEIYSLVYPPIHSHPPVPSAATVKLALVSLLVPPLVLNQLISN